MHLDKESSETSENTHQCEPQGRIVCVGTECIDTASLSPLCGQSKIWTPCMEAVQGQKPKDGKEIVDR